MSTTRELIHETAIRHGWFRADDFRGSVEYRRYCPHADGRQEKLLLWFSTNNKLLRARWFSQLYVPHAEIDVPYRARATVLAWLLLPATATVEQHRAVGAYSSSMTH